MDHANQSEPGGDWNWKSRASARLLDGELSAQHDGYEGLGVVHSRTLRLADDGLEVVDQVDGQGQHHIAISFHLAPETVIDGRRVTGPIPLAFSESPLNFKVVSQDAEPGPGAHSPRYGVLTKAPTVIFEGEVELPYTHTVTLRWG